MESHTQTSASTDASGRRIPWILGGALILLLVVRDILVTEGGVIGHSAYWGRDFVNVWTGGTLVRDGLLSSLYDVKAYQAFQQGIFGDLDLHYYSYPPASFPLASIFSLLPYWLGLIAWTVATCTLFVFAVRPWWPDKAGPRWLAILTPAALVNLWAGQYGILIGSLFLLAWTNLDSNPRRAGIFFGLMLIKPHLAILAPLILLIRKQWTAFAWAAATVVAIIVATIAAYGVDPWRNYLLHTSGVHVGLLNGLGLAGMMSASSITAVLRVGGSMAVATSVYAVFAIAALAMVVRAAASRAPTRDVAFLAATATFLIVPYSFNYDLTVVMVGAIWLLTRDNLTRSDRRLALCGFLAPQVGMLLTALFIPAMPLMLLGLAYTQYRLALHSGERTNDPTPESDALTSRTALAG